MRSLSSQMMRRAPLASMPDCSDRKRSALLSISCGDAPRLNPYLIRVMTCLFCTMSVRFGYRR